MYLARRRWMSQPASSPTRWRRHPRRTARIIPLACLTAVGQALKRKRGARTERRPRLLPAGPRRPVTAPATCPSRTPGDVVALRGRPLRRLLRGHRGNAEDGERPVGLLGDANRDVAAVEQMVDVASLPSQRHDADPQTDAWKLRDVVSNAAGYDHGAKIPGVGEQQVEGGVAVVRHNVD